MNIILFYYIIMRYKGCGNLKTRTIWGAVLLLVLFGSLFAGYKVFALVMLCVAILGYKELVNIKYEKHLQSIEVIRFIGYVGIMLMVLNNIFFRIADRLVIVALILSLTIPVIFYNNHKKYNINDALYFMGVIFFLGFAFNNIIYLSKLDVHKCILIFIIAFVTDTYAYIGGKLIGKHKFTSISPNKTVEGSIIGTFVGVMASSVYYFMFIDNKNILFVLVACLGLTLLSEIGDLVFSSIKRYFNKKDYSNFIPGHGGILDRFDSVIFVSLGLTLLINLL